MATVDLSWTDNSSSENGFYIYRTTTSSPSWPSDYSVIDSVGVDVTTYSDTSAPDGTTVYYAVTAYNSNGESSPAQNNITTSSATASESVSLTATTSPSATVSTASAGTSTSLTATVTVSASESVPGTWYDSAWDYRKPITIDSAQVSGGPHTDFPLLVDITDSDLASKAQSSGDDILFTASDGTTKLDHEIESYDSANGILHAWVKKPSLDGSSDGKIYIYYGNSGAANQENVSGTWSNGWTHVYHLDETSAPASDSGPNGYDSTGESSVTWSESGSLDGAISSNGYLSFGDTGDPTGDVTLHAFVTIGSDTSTTGQRMIVKDNGGPGWALSFADSGSPYGRFFVREDSDIIVDGTTSLSANTEYMIHGREDTGDGDRTIWIDGTQDGSVTGISGIDGNAASLGVTGDPTSGGSSFDGIVQEARISGVARSDGWLITEANNYQNSMLTVGAEEQSSGTTVSESVSLLVSPSVLSTSETGISSEAVSTAALASLAASETGSGSEAASLLANLTGNASVPTATGSSTASLQASGLVSASETGASAESSAATLNVSTAASETGIGTESGDLVVSFSPNATASASAAVASSLLVSTFFQTTETTSTGAVENVALAVNSSLGSSVDYAAGSDSASLLMDFTSSTDDVGVGKAGSGLDISITSDASEGPAVAGESTAMQVQISTRGDETGAASETSSLTATISADTVESIFQVLDRISLDSVRSLEVDADSARQLLDKLESEKDLEEEFDSKGEQG